MSDRRKEVGRPHEIESWTGFAFPGRGDRYSALKYSWRSFSGINYDARSKTKSIFKFVGPEKPGWVSYPFDLRPMVSRRSASEKQKHDAINRHNILWNSDQGLTQAFRRRMSVKSLAIMTTCVFKHSYGTAR